MSPRPRVWVTRAQPGAQATAARLMERGFDPLVAPVLNLTPVGEGSISGDDAAAIAFTSANGVDAFAPRFARRDLPVFAVGAATAAAARRAGFDPVTSAAGDAAALAARILNQPPTGGVVLCPGPEEPAADLVGLLESGGVAARRLVVYGARAGVPANLGALLPDLNAVLLHSARAAGAVAAWLGGYSSRHLIALCLSPAVAAALGETVFRAVIAAEQPDEASLLSALELALPGNTLRDRP